IAYGAVSRSALRAVRLARSRGIRAGLLQLITLFPFPRKAVEGVLRQCRRVLVPEMNMGQMIREVKRVNLATEIVRHNRVDGQFITPAEIYDHLLSM
ncbi:MAG: 2-oxoacid:acceptor oxidoreductase subunit alpha, partial [Proteobacteria bacterium]|nr:2-oxoacid:acceptor oxidoreductase subunit alpha [Pseudomonadota bacterium]